jgi:RimJ/RimL family protein N-acetyltransferase
MPRRIAGALRNRLWRRLELCLYAITAERVRTLPHTSRLKRDAWEDLAYCVEWSYPNLTRDQYLQAVDERRRSGPHHLYSLVENGILVHYGWLTSRQDRAPDAALGLVFMPPPRSAALWDYFTHSAARGRGLYRDSLRQCMHDAVATDGADTVFIYVYADNEVSRNAIEKAGFEYRGSLVMERRFFSTRRYASSTGQPLDVRLLSDDGPAPVVLANRSDVGSRARSWFRVAESRTTNKATAK